MGAEARLSRQEFLRMLPRVAGAAGLTGLLASCGPNEQVLRDRVFKPAQATQTAIENNILRYIGSITVPPPPLPNIEAHTLNQEEIQSIILSGESAAQAHAREQINSVFDNHDQLDPIQGMNREIADWIYAFIDNKNGHFASSDYDVLDAALPYVWYEDLQHLTREDILYLLAQARQSGNWEGHPPVSDELIDFTWSIGAKNWGYDEVDFKTKPQYEHLRTSLIETPARALVAVQKMEDLDLFAHPDLAIPSVGLLVAFGMSETGGWRRIGDSGAARDNAPFQYVDYVVQYTRESTGVNVPLTIEGSSAGAIGPQILPGNFVNAVNYAKEHTPQAKLNPLDIVDGMIFTAIYLQQYHYDASGDNAKLPDNEKFWYYSNKDTPDEMYTVMQRWNDKPDQDRLLTNAHFDYMRMMSKQSMNRRQMLLSSLGVLF